MKTVEITYRYDADEAAARERPADAAAARARLEEGSRSTAALLADLTEGTGTTRRVIHVDPRDLGLAHGESIAPAQRPYAAIVGCADARVPVEIIFNEGPNDLFVVRVAGNGLGSEVMGSLRYAVEHLGSLKLVVVLGHSGCGAVSAAVDVFLDPVAYLDLAHKHALRGILDRLQVVIHSSARRLAAVYGPEVARHPRYRDALVEAAVVSNAALSAHTLQQELTVAGEHAVRAAYGVYLIDERRVWAPRCGDAGVDGLADPPATAAEFGLFADAVVRSQRIAGMLG
ncbi:MAG: carbonic anhydrase [Casimicrobiaceae bacterium]